MKKRVRLLKPHTHNNRTFRPGRILELNEGTAAFLIRVGTGESVEVPNLPAPIPRRGTRKAKPVTPSPTPPLE